MTDSNELFSEVILELYKNPQNRGKLNVPSLEVSGGNPICGDKATIFLKLEGNTVVDASFENVGCAISTAAASLLTEMVKGKTIIEVLEITPHQMFDELGGIIQTRIKCATLALVLLKEGLRQYQKNPAKTAISGIRV